MALLGYSPAKNCLRSTKALLVKYPNYHVYISIILASQVTTAKVVAQLRFRAVVVALFHLYINSIYTLKGLKYYKIVIYLIGCFELKYLNSDSYTPQGGSSDQRVINGEIKVKLEVKKLFSI